MDALISIIIPMYNAEKTIEKTICETRKIVTPCEIILVDDGSTDETLSICNRYAEKDKRIRIVETENGGVSHARNVGIKAATSEYIIFLDADDYYLTNSFDKYISVMKAERSDIAVCGVIKEEQGGIDFYCIPSFPGEYRTYHDNIEELRRFVIERDYSMFPELQNCNTGKRKMAPIRLGSPWGKIFKKSILQKEKIFFNENISMMEDLLFVNEYFKRIQSATFFSDPIYYYTKNSGSATNKKYNRNALNYYKDTALGLASLKHDYDSVYERNVQIKIFDCCWAAIHIGIINNEALSVREKKREIDEYLTDQLWKENIQYLMRQPLGHGKIWIKTQLLGRGLTGTLAIFEHL